MKYSHEQLWASVKEQSIEGGLSWLEARIEEAKESPSSVVRPFAAASRKVGHKSIEVVEIDGDNSDRDNSDRDNSDRDNSDRDNSDPYSWTVDDAARVLLLLCIGDLAWNYVDDLFHYGDTAERRGVLRALPMLPNSMDGLAIVNEAIRCNEPVLVATALNEYAFEHFTDDQINQAVLKCVFLDIPLLKIDSLIDRANPKLAQMLARLARERVAAGREVADDIWTFVCEFPPESELAAIESDLDSRIEQRRFAAQKAIIGMKNAGAQRVKLAE